MTQVAIQGSSRNHAMHFSDYSTAVKACLKLRPLSSTINVKSQCMRLCDKSISSLGMPCNNLVTFLHIPCENLVSFDIIYLLQLLAKYLHN